MRPSDKLEQSIREELSFRAGSDLRKRLWADIAAAQAQTESQLPAFQRPVLWRRIMRSRMTHIAAALLLLVGLVALSRWGSAGPPKPTYATMFTLLSAVNAAEQSLYYQSDGIRYMANEIVLHPRQTPTAEELLERLSQDVTRENNIAFMNAYLHDAALPLTVLNADGEPELQKLALSETADQAVTLVDESWYDPPSGRFVRVVRRGEQVLFANAYDGQAVYTTVGSAAEGLPVEREGIGALFQAPTNPADFLGLAAGIATGIPQQHFPPTQEVTDDTLADGTPVRVYKLGFENFEDELETFYLFKQSIADETLAEIVCVVGHQVLSEHRRMATDTVEEPGLPWDLQGLTVTENVDTEVKTEEFAVPEVTPAEMAAGADFEAALFATLPPWTELRHLFQFPDPIGGGHGYIALYLAEDGRHVLMGLAPSFNMYMKAIVQKHEQEGRSFPWDHTTTTGFKIMRQTDSGKLWWTEIGIKNCGLEPAPDREGFFCQSPGGFYFNIAVNGPVTEEEMLGLADSLILASEYREPED